MQCGFVNTYPVVSEHVKKSGLTRVVQSQEHQLAAFVHESQALKHAFEPVEYKHFCIIK